MSKIIRYEHLDVTHKDILVVNWCLTTNCNYTCSYCPQGLHDASTKPVEFEKVKELCNKIINRYQHGKRIYFEFTGGEITYYNKFIDLAKYLKERSSLGILSNGSKKLNWWKEILPFLDHVCLSYHAEYSDPKHMIDLIKLLRSHVRVHLNIMMHPKLFDKCYKFARRAVIEMNDHSVQLQTLFHEFVGPAYTYSEKQQKILSNPGFKGKGLAKIWWHLKDFNKKGIPSHNNKIFRGPLKAVYDDGNFKIITSPELIAQKANSWTGWTCYIGLENIVIDPSGNIYRGWCFEGGKIGNVNDNNIEFPNAPIICQKDRCHCGFDIMSTKVAPKGISA